MATTPRGVWTPDDTKNYDLTTDLATMAVSIDTAISAVDKPQAFRTGTAAQRIAALASSPEGTTWQDTDGHLGRSVKQNGKWVTTILRTIAVAPQGTNTANNQINYRDLVPLTFGVTFTENPALETNYSTVWGAIQTFQVTGISTTGFSHRAIRFLSPVDSSSVVVTWKATGVIA